jgi:hypothetical protein
MVYFGSSLVGIYLLARGEGSVLIVPFGPWVDEVYWTLPIEVAFCILVCC